MPYSDPKEAAAYRREWKRRKRAAGKLTIGEKIRRGRELAALVAERQKARPKVPQP